MKRIVAAVFLVAGCASSEPDMRSESAELPASQQTVTSDARARSNAHTDLGTLYLQGRQANVALEEARMAIKADSSNALAYNLLAQIYAFVGDPATALSNFERAISLSPGDPQINNDFGWFLCERGREAEGLARLNQAAAHPLNPAPSRAWFNAGLCALRQKDDAAAEAYFRKAMLADSTNRAAIFQLASVMYRRGGDADAQRLVQELHRLDEPNAESLWLGVRVEHRLGNRQAEASYVSQLRRKFPNSPEYQNYLKGNFE
jgi:type IV pilus assembly protein PilF